MCVRSSLEERLARLIGLQQKRCTEGLKSAGVVVFACSDASLLPVLAL